jgi:T5SS/PEP-CTERM-associated repeat protein
MRATAGAVVRSRCVFFMKTWNEIIFAGTSRILFAVLLLAGAQVHLHAQLVADGTTAFINGTSVNLTGNLVVGTNGSFTTLVITNTGAVTNSGTSYIGLNPTARTNRVIVTGANSDWNIGGNLDFGDYGSYSQLIVTNGGRVEDNFGNMGFNAGSVGNSAVVTGANSVWTNHSNVNVGNSAGFNRVTVSNGGTLGAGFVTVGNTGPSNQLTVASGGKIVSGGGRLGNNASAPGNVAVITDAGSQWNSSSDIELGTSSSFNQLILTNGAKIISAGAYVGANPIQDGSGNSNLVVIAGGATWTNSSAATVGNLGAFNQLVITNGGVLRDTTSGGNLTIGFNTSSSNNVVTVSGTNSLFANNGVAGLPLIYVGFLGSQNQLLVANDGTAQTENLYVGYAASSSNNAVTLSGGNLFVTNASGTGVTDVRNGTLTLFPGVLQTDWLLLTNGQRSQFSFNGGTLRTRNTSVTNNSTVVVSANSRFELLGNGTHAFADGLQIMNNGAVAGNGTINGKLNILIGGTFAPGSGDTSPGMAKIILNTSPLWQGTIIMKISKSGTMLTNDQIEVTAPLFFGGWLVVSNLGPDTLSVGDNFKLFSGTTLSGNLSAIYLPPLPPGLTWTNKLLVDGSIEVVPWSGPKITTDFSASPYLYLDATDGFPGWPYDVLSSTNLATTNWTVVVSDYFDWNGVARIYLGNTNATPTQFFWLRTHAP